MSVSEDMLSTFDMESLLNTPEFDMLLDQIEQDIGAKEDGAAVGKHGTPPSPLLSVMTTCLCVSVCLLTGEEGEEMSELSEVLLFLARSAEEKTPRPTAPLSRTGVTLLPQPPPPTAPMPMPPQPPEPRADPHTSRPAESKRHTRGDAASTGRGGGRGRGRGGGYGRGGAGSDIVSVEPTSDEDRGNEEDVGEDDDWAGLRQKMKRRGGSPEKVGGGVGVHCWGAYGMPSSLRPTGTGVVTSVQTQQQEGGVEEESAEDESEDNDSVSSDVNSSCSGGGVEAENITPECDHDSPTESAPSSPLRDSPHRESPPLSSSPASEEGLISQAPEVLAAPCAAGEDRPFLEEKSVPVSAMNLTAPERGGDGGGATRTGGILGESSSSRTRRAKGGSRLKGSVEVAIKRREERSAVLNTTASPPSTEHSTQPEKRTDKAQPVLETVAADEAEEEGLPDEEAPLSSVLVPSTSPLCPVLPPHMHTVLQDPEHLQSGKGAKECQNVVVLKFDVSGNSSAIREGHSQQGSLSDGADAARYMILAWVSSRLEGWEATIVGVHLSSTQDGVEAESVSCPAVTFLCIVLEGSNPHSTMFLSKAVMQDMQSTHLADVMCAFDPPQTEAPHSSPVKGASLSTIGSVVPPESAAPLLQQVSLSPPTVASGKDWRKRLTQNAVVTCVLKPYLLLDGRLLAKVFTLCDEAGLRLSGLRTAYVQRSSASFGMEVHPDILSQVGQKGTPITSDRDGAACVLVALFYSSRFVAADILRDLLGPDDPSLAKRTDPTSIRAVCGVSKVANVCYQLSSLLANCWRDTLFWFGPRITYNFVPSSLHSIVLPPLRYAVIGISIESSFSEEAELLDHSKMNRAANKMALLQRMCFQCMQSVTAKAMHFVTMWSCDRAELTRYGLLVSNEAEYVHGPACYVTAVFVSHAGDCHVDTVQTALKKKLVQISSLTDDLFVVNMSLKMKDRFRRHEHLRPAVSNSQFLSSRLFTDDDFDSHEDVGLQDVVVCSVSTHRDVLDGTYALSPQEVALHILQALPPACQATLLGISTPNWEVPAGRSNTDLDYLSLSFAADKIHLCLRGLHLIENIAHAIQVGTEAVNGIATSSGGVLMTSADIRMKSVSTPRVEDVRVLRGRRALDVICREFLVQRDSFMTQFAVSHLHSYVPSWEIGRDDATGEPRVGVQADTAVLRSLFCPGSFRAVSVVVVPYPAADKNGAQAGVFFRVLKKLEKDGFDVKYVSSTVMTSAMAELCAADVTQDSDEDYCTDSAKAATLREKFALLVDKPVLAIVVEGNSALRRLRSVVGPIDQNDAVENYPGSLVACIASFVQPEGGPALVAPHSVFFSRTCASTEKYIKAFCDCGSVGAYELSLGPAMSTAEKTDEGAVAWDSPGSVQGHRSHSSELEAALCILRDQSLAVQQKKDKANIVILPTESVAASALDVTCIILTSALTNLIGISPILHAINKEGIKVSTKWISGTLESD